MNVEQAGVLNIDDELDPQLCGTYAKEISSYLHSIEHKFKPSDYLGNKTQADLNEEMRSILMDWLVDVADEYKLCQETIYLTVNYIDRYLSVVPIHRGQLQLVGVTAMLVASKFEEIHAPSVAEFSYITDNTYTTDDILDKEVELLNTLEFSLSMSSSNVFLTRLLRGISADTKLWLLARYLCELTILEYGFIKYNPSLIAASSVSLALHTLSLPAWNASLQHYSGLCQQDVMECIFEIYSIYIRVSTGAIRFTSIKEKYSDVKRLSVATECIPRGIPVVETSHVL